MRQIITITATLLVCGAVNANGTVNASPAVSTNGTVNANGAVNARGPREIFTKAFDAIPDKAATFKPGGEWFPYPAWEDRAGWDEMTGAYKDALIKQGEKYLNFKWIPVTAMDYLEYEKTKDRGIMRKKDLPNREALAELTLAELAEGKGRFLPQIINGLYYAAERTSWSHAQHTTVQSNGRTLPTQYERTISLLSASYAMNVAMGWHFFHKEFDKIDPSISRTILKSLEINTFKPYLEKTFWWMGFGDSKDSAPGGASGKTVNNWNCHCNFYCTAAFLLADQDSSRLLKAVEQSVRSFDRYMDYVKMDGACEEGPSYWTMAAGKVYDYARMMYDASYGKIDVLKDIQVRRMGEYKVNCWIGDGWQLIFSDGDARPTAGSKNDDLYTRYGYDCGSKELENLGIILHADKENGGFKLCGTSTESEGKEQYRCLEVLRFQNRLKADEDSLLEAAGGDLDKMCSDYVKSLKSDCYPETEVAVLRNPQGWYVGAKGGNNGESHGHLDVGSALVFVDQCPLFIDPGVESYGINTFGANRFKQWWAITEWHNLPLVNGLNQGNGKAFKAKGFSCNPEAGTMKCDIAGAWPEEAEVTSWVRSYSLGKDDLTISDSYTLKARRSADDIHFITPGEVFLPGAVVDGRKLKEGEIVVIAKSHEGDRTVRMLVTYPSSLKASVEKKEMTDKRFRRHWHEALYKITLKSSDKAGLGNKYTYKITRL